MQYNKQNESTLSVSGITCHHCGHNVSHWVQQDELHIVDKSIKIIFKCTSCHNILTKSYKTVRI